MSLFNIKPVRRLSRVRCLKSIRRSRRDQPLESRTSFFLRKYTFRMVFGALLGFGLIILVHPVHASRMLESHANSAGMAQALTTSLPVSTPQPTPVRPSGRPVQITPGLVVLFVVGLLIALAMSGIGLALGLWMKRHDKT